MKFRFLLTLILITSIANTSVNADDNYAPLTTLIAELANMAVMASQCEARLINFGSKAMEQKECIDFMTSFIRKWPDRDFLEDEIVDIVTRIEEGEISCDESCRNMLIRCEELRITVTYVLDYMDYVVEEGL